MSRGRPRGDQRPTPPAGIVFAEARFCTFGTLGQDRRTLDGRHRERPHGAGLDLADRASGDVER